MQALFRLFGSERSDIHCIVCGILGPRRREERIHPMKSVLAKWGNSLAVRIPAGIARELGFEAGAMIDVKNDNGRFVVESRASYDLKALLNSITPTNQHGEVDFGEAKGRESYGA